MAVVPCDARTGRNHVHRVNVLPRHETDASEYVARISVSDVDDQPAQAAHRSADPEGSARSSASSRSTSSPPANT